MKPTIFYLFSFYLLSCASSARPETNGTTYLDSTRTLTRAARYEEALQRHLWFDRHIVETDKSMSAVKRSFALSYWLELGEHYPPAIDSFKRIRDEKTTELIAKGNSVDLFSDVVSMNRYLDENIKSVELYDLITHRYPPFAKKTWEFVIDQLLESKRYDLIELNLDNPMKAYDGFASLYLSLMEDTGIFSDNFTQIAKDGYLKSCMMLIQYCIAINDHASVEKIKNKMATMEL